MVKTNRWCRKNHLGWALLSPWSNKSTAATAATNCISLQNTNPRRGKGCGGKMEIQKEMIPSPTDAGCTEKREKLSNQPSTKEGSGSAGQDCNVPSLPSTRQCCALTRGAQAAPACVCAWGHVEAESWWFSEHLPFPNLGWKDEWRWPALNFISCLLRMNKCFQKMVSVMCFKDQW